MTSKIIIGLSQVTNQNEMETTSPPLLHGLFPVFGYIIFDFLLLHEGRKNGLVNGVI